MHQGQIRLLKKTEDFRECERIQQAVWGTLSVSTEVLIVTQKHAGVVLGAFAGRKVVGFIYAFLGQSNHHLIHWSHMMAVLPEFRNRGLGYRMKLVHRKLALERGIKSICWTYDPLQSRNATLNIGRLGGYAEEYLPDCYGNFPSQIEKGLPTDRLVVNWRVSSAEVERRLHRPSRAGVIPSHPIINVTQSSTQGFIRNIQIFLHLRHPKLLLEIPPNTDEMRAHALSLAKCWRMETRKIFLKYLASGYRVDGFISPSQLSQGRCFYVLRKVG